LWSPPLESAPAYDSPRKDLKDCKDIKDEEKCPVVFVLWVLAVPWVLVLLLVWR